MQTLEQSADFLADLSRSNAEYSEALIDPTVDAYVVGFGPLATKPRRDELAAAFIARAPVSDLTELIRKRIMRED
jgi:hypothetical protein